MKAILDMFARVLLVTIFICPAVVSQTTAFTYQGSLNTSGSPANGNHDFEFALFDSLGGGTQLGSTLTRTNIAVANGVFSASLDFGGQFPGANRFLEIRVRTSGGGGFTTLAPRQPVNSAPYSIKSLATETAANATNAGNASQLGGVAADQYVLTGDPRMVDARNPLPGSAGYIQNQNAAPQSASNFNISGSGTLGGTLAANNVRATTQFEIGGSRVLATSFESTFLGLGAGIVTSTTSNTFNTFVGSNAGNANTTGQQNSFFGVDVGRSNVTGVRNSFFGALSGTVSVGSDNSFFGDHAGFTNSSGAGNSFFGSASGLLTTTGTSNTFIGVNAGRANAEGSQNAFFGRSSGVSSTTGASNSFFGFQSGTNNQTGSNNTILGAGANVSTVDLNFATAIGAGALVSTSNTLVIGRATDTVQVPGALNLTGSLTGNTISATTQFNIGNERVLFVTAGGNNTFIGRGTGSVNTGVQNTFVGDNAGTINSNGASNSFFGNGAGRFNTIGSQNSFFGLFAGNDNSTGSNNSFFGRFAGEQNTTANSNSYFGESAGTAVTSGAGNSFVGAQAGDNNVSGNNNSLFGHLSDLADGLVNATAIGFRSFVTQSNSLVLGGINGVNFGTDTNVGIGTTAPAHRLHVVGNGLFTGTLAATVVNGITQFNLGGNRVLHGPGTSNLFVGVDSGTANTTGSANAFFGVGSGADNLGGTDNSFFGVNTGRGNTSGSSNSYFGRLAGRNKTTGSNNTGVGVGAGGNGNNGDNLTMIGANADVSVAGLSFATAIGAGATVDASNTVQIGRVTDTINLSGKLKVGVLGSSGATALCRNASNEIGTCSSSMRYKSNVNSFSSGLSLIKRLRPVSFNWRDGGMLDLGLVAEEVAKVEPLLTTTNSKGDIEGVKYDRVSVVLVNAVTEQQAQIEAQVQLIKRQQQQIDALRNLVCATNRSADICKEK